MCQELRKDCCAFCAYSKIIGDVTSTVHERLICQCEAKRKDLQSDKIAQTKARLEAIGEELILEETKAIRFPKRYSMLVRPYDYCEHFKLEEVYEYAQ